MAETPTDERQTLYVFIDPTSYIRHQVEGWASLARAKEFSFLSYTTFNGTVFF